MGVYACLHLSTRYSVYDWFLEMKGITLSFFLGVVGVPGICKTSQKSSARRPERYPCRVSGAESVSLVFPFSLAEDWLSGFRLQINVCGVPGGCVVGDGVPGVVFPIPGRGVEGN